MIQCIDCCTAEKSSKQYLELSCSSRAVIKKNRGNKQRELTEIRKQKLKSQLSFDVPKKRAQGQLWAVMPDGEGENIPPFPHFAHRTVYGSRGSHEAPSAPTCRPHLLFSPRGGDALLSTPPPYMKYI